MKVLSPIIFSATIVSFKCVASEPYVFKRFDVTDGLPSTQVYQSIQDKDGYMWFATDRGVSRYDGHNFTTFSRKDGLTDEVVFGFFLESNNRLWFYTYHGGLCYYHNNEIIEPPFNNKLKNLLDKMGYPVIVSLFIDEKQNKWFGTEYQQIIKVSENGDIELVLGDEKPAIPSKITLIEPGSNAYPNLIHFGGKSQYPLPQLEILSYPDTTSRVINIPFEQGYSYSYITCRATFCRVDRNTFIYAFGSELFKIENNKIVQKHNLGADYHILYALLIDSHGSLWVGTRKGVFCFNQADLSLKPQHYLDSYQISSVYQDHEGGFWFTCLENSLFYLPHFDIKSYVTTKATTIASNSFGIYVGLANDDLLILPGGRSEKVKTYKGHYSNYSLLVKRKDHILTRWGTRRNFFKDTVGLPVLPKYHAAKRNDDRSDFLWSWHIGKLSFSFFSTADSSKVNTIQIPQTRVRCATATSGFKKVWLGLSKGLLIYEGQTLKHLHEDFTEFNTRIADLDLINDHYLLVTTRGNGVFKYDYKQQKVIKLKGILNESCNDSFIDSKGRVWVSSFSGVTRIDCIESDQPEYYYYNKRCGLISNEVYQVTEYNDSIWAATAKGISHWYSDWTPNPKENKARINLITVNGKERALKKSRKLNYMENHLQFFFNTISFQEPVEYHYRLKGLHSNWIKTNDRNAVYSSLKPGHYTFELKHADEEVIQSSVAFTIAPPLWLNRWFWVSVILLVIVALIYVLRIRYHIIRKENKLYELFTRSEQKALRAQINPHFLFNSFNSILELVYRKEYNSVQTYMKRLAQLMRLVLQNSREEEISLAQELELLERYLELEKLRFGNFLHFSIEVKNQLDPLKTLLPSLLLQPYVENALKHGIRSRMDGNGLLQIIFDLKNGQLRVQIIDNGKGYSNTVQNITNKRKSYGMKINGERIQLFSEKEDFNIEISALNPLDDIYPGTIVELYLPLKTASQYETSIL